MNFKANDKRIENFNNQTNRTYEQGHNSHSDSSFAENQKFRTGLKAPAPPPTNVAMYKSGAATKAPILPKSVDYRKSLQQIKDQKGERTIIDNKFNNI